MTTVPSSEARLVHCAAAVEFSRPLPPAADASVWFVVADESTSPVAAAAPGLAEPPAACDVPGWSSASKESGKASATEAMDETTLWRTLSPIDEKISTRWEAEAVVVRARSAAVAKVRWCVSVPEPLVPRWCAAVAAVLLPPLATVRSTSDAGGNEEERKGSA